jgi:hypothetical protein
MKKMTISVIVVLAAMISFAQTQSSDHLVFEGIPVGETFSEYVSKMQQNGFTYIDTKKGEARLRGNFAGYKECTIRVTVSEQQDSVGKIAVRLPYRSVCSWLESDYFSLKKMLTEKYGKPIRCAETISGSRYSRRNTISHSYYATYETGKEYIELSICNTFDPPNGNVMLAYYSKKNSIAKPKPAFTTDLTLPNILKIIVLVVMGMCPLYLGYSATIGMNRIIRKYPDRKFHLQCKKCGNISEHDSEEYIRLRRKPNNKSITGGYSFRLPCEKCEKKTMQAILDYPWRREALIGLAKAFGVVIIVVIFCAIAISIIENNG